MKKLTILLSAILCVSILCASLTSCVKIDEKEGLNYLIEAYENTVVDADIFQYTEKIYDKATAEKDGYIINRKVNVNCAVDKHYNLIRNEDYAISLYEDKYIEKIDATTKLTSNKVASNSIKVGEAHKTGDKSNIINTLFVNTSGKEDKKYCQVGVQAISFYNSNYFKRYQLLELDAMRELYTIIRDSRYIDFNIKKGGIQRNGRTTDFTFKVKDVYLDMYEKKNGVPSVFAGKYVWVQTSYDRIANIYVYKEENLGTGLKLDYECYTLMITYLGPKVDLPDVSNEDSKVIFDEDFAEGILEDIDR